MKFELDSGTGTDLEGGFHTFRLVSQNGNSIEASNVNYSTGVITFTDIPSGALQAIPADSALTYYLTASTPTLPNMGSPISLKTTVTPADVVFVGTDGQDKNPALADISPAVKSKDLFAVKNKVLLTQVSDSNTSLSGNALKFNVQATGTGGNVKITELVVKANLTSYDSWNHDNDAATKDMF